MTEWQMYRKILSNVKECRRDKHKMFGSGLPLTERILNRLKDRNLNIFIVDRTGSKTFVISGYMLEEVKLRDISTRKEWEAAREKAAADKDVQPVQDVTPYVITEVVDADIS